MVSLLFTWCMIVGIGWAVVRLAEHVYHKSWYLPDKGGDDAS